MCALALVKSLALMGASEGYSRGVHGPQRPFGATFLGMPALLVLEPSELHAHMRYDVWGLHAVFGFAHLGRSAEFFKWLFAE